MVGISKNSPVLVLIVLLLLSACTVPPTTPPNHQELLSPDSIAKNTQDNDFAALENAWQQLEASPPDQLSDLLDSGLSSIQRVYFNVNDTEYALLILKAKDFQWWQYLLFRLEGNEWEFLGDINLDTDRDGIEPDYQVVTDDKQDVWLVVRSLNSIGTGILIYDESWYWLSGEKLKEVFSYPVEQLQSAPSPEYPADFELKGELASYWQEDDTFYVALSFEATYSFYEDRRDYHLFTLDRREVYVWSLEDTRFVIEPEKTEGNQEFPFASDEYLAYTFGELVELADNGGDAQKRWVRQLLSETEDSKGKEELLMILDNTP